MFKVNNKDSRTTLTNGVNLRGIDDLITVTSRDFEKK